MTWSLTSPITGAAVTGFTSPTYTHVADQAPDVNGKQVAITALGGTQAGVTAHTVASPFTIAFWKPKIFKFLGKPNPTTGLIADVPRNTYKVVGRKGVTPAANQPAAVMDATLVVNIPAGAETYDAANVKALLSAMIGALSQQSAGLSDTAVTGIP